MKRTTLLLLVTLGAAWCTLAQAQEQLDVEAACSYYGESPDEALWGFDSDRDAEDAVTRIMNYTGLPQNFEVMRGNVDNAMAAIRGESRVIVYSQSFMERVKQETNTDWSAVSILAHEIGHHLAGHTLSKDGSRPKTELEADKFSGHVLFKMGAQLEDAKAAMRAVAGDAGSSTHPPKSARLVAIETGWFDARDQSPQQTAQREQPQDPAPQSQPQTQSQTQPARQQPQPAPVMPAPTNEPEVFAEVHFIDGGVAYVLDNNTIVMVYMGITYPVAVRQASNDPNFAWLYVIKPADAATEAMMQMWGMSTETVYGVDHQGNVWGSNMWGQPAQLGMVYYE